LPELGVGAARAGAQKFTPLARRAFFANS